MTAQIDFDDYEFTVSALTEAGVVTSLHFDVQETMKGIIATTTSCALYGDERRSYPGELILTIERLVTNAVRWQVAASMQHPIKGVKVKVDPVTGTSLLEAGGNPVEIEDGQGYATVFPSAWTMSPRIPQSGITPAGANGSQHLFIEGGRDLLMLASDDHPPRTQRYWAFREGDQLALTVYLEANVSDRENQISSPYWTLEVVPDYETGIQKHLKWVQDAYGLSSIEQRPDAPDWVQDICFNITFHCQANHGRVNVTFADIEEILERAASYFNPAQTQLHVVGWDGPWDTTWPAFQPGAELGGPEGFRRMMDTVHRLGYKIGLHMNVMGLSYQHPQFAELKHFLQYQCRDSANRPLNWEHDLDGDDQDNLIFAYISPDAPEWRNYLVERILEFVASYQTDIVHLDQSTTFINDHNYDHFRGLNALFHQLREKLPAEVALSGEFTSEIVAHLYPLCGYFPLSKPEVQKLLWIPYIRAFNYGHFTEPTRESLLYDAFERHPWQAENFYRDLDEAEKAGLMPTLLVGKADVNLDSPEATAVFAAARRFREMVQTKDI